MSRLTAFFPLVPVLLFAASQSTPDSVIRQVESGLTRRVHVTGQPVEKWTIEQRLQHYHVPGVSVAVLVDGKLSWAKGYGAASKEDGVPVTPDTLFQAASISKPVSAIIALRLVELGKLSLDEDVNLKLRSWKVPDSPAMAGEHVTLRRILSHTAGLTVHGFAGYAQGEARPTLPQLLNGVKPANSDPVRVDIKPGTQWRYAGGGYEVMQQLIEDVTGKPYAEVAHDLVLQPLEMTHSTYEQPLPEPLRAKAATAYDESGKPIAGKWHIYPEQAAAGLWTTPSDLCKVILEMQQPGRVLKPATVDLMLTPVMNEYGLGFGISKKNGQVSFSHGGANEGFRCQLFAYRQGGRGAVVMTNGDAGGAVADEILTSIAATYGWPAFAPIQKTAIQVPADKLASLAGVYRATSGPQDFEIKVTVSGDKLYIQPPHGGPVQVLPESGNKFFDPDGGLPDITFENTPAGWQLSGGGLTAKRVH